jgi:hypothetical protein
VIHAIVRLFDSAARAQEGIQRLKTWGFDDEVVSVVAPTGGSEEAITKAIAGAHVLTSHARVYAKGVARGGTLVVVRAPFGMSVIAGQLLDSAGTIDAGQVPGEPRGATWDDAAPLSSAFRLPLLSRRGSYYMSPVLATSGSTTCSAFGIPELQESGKPTTGDEGLISRNPTPLSSLLKLPTLL